MYKPNNKRPVEQSDIDSAIRGLGLAKLSITDDELLALVEKHTDIDMFASQVIAEAALRVLSARLVCDQLRSGLLSAGGYRDAQ